MTDLRARVSALFVAPTAVAGSVPRRAIAGRAASATLPPSVGVLGGAEAGPLAVALAAALARRRRAPAALVCRWSPSASPSVAWMPPAGVAASRFAATLRARGHDARATGRVAIVELSDDGSAAAAEASRAAAVAGEAPVVLALTGPRPTALDEALERQDLVVVTHVTASGAAATAAALARERLAQTLPGIAVHAFPVGRTPRLAACAPFLATRATAPLTAVLEDLA